MHLQKVLTYKGHSESLTVLHEGGRLEKQFCQGFRLLPLTSLPNNRILYRSKYKALADNKINGTQELKFVEMLLLLFPKCLFLKHSYSKVIKTRDCVLKRSGMYQSLKMDKTDNNKIPAKERHDP